MVVFKERDDNYHSNIINHKFLYLMSGKKKQSKTNLWLAIGALFLIILLIIWLTVADFLGDTDVAAFITPTII